MGDKTCVSVTYGNLPAEIEPDQMILIDDGLGGTQVRETRGKDIDDIRFGIEHDFDFIAASFIRRASDVEVIREVLRTYGGEKIQIIAKIENQEGLDNLDEIIAAADEIMVARGDLGVEIPAAQVHILKNR